MSKINSRKPQTISRPWTWETDEIVKELGVSPQKGLTEAQSRKRRRQYGENRLKEKDRKNIWVILKNQFKSLVIVLLAAASAISFVFGNRIESLAIAAAIIINTVIGFFTELKAVRMMEALKQMGKVSTKVRRNGNSEEIPAEKIVPGDIVIIEAGDIVTADIRLLEASKLHADESALTGESVPVNKTTGKLDRDTPLAERNNMIFKGTSVTSGSGEGVVAATGMETELGRVASLVEEAEEEITPLEKRLNRLGQRLIWITITIAAFVAVTGIIAGKEMLLMVEVSIALAIAAIPEGLPIVATIALARGMLRMAARNALVNRLSAVETLGATNVIFTDKTGTLTENRLMVRQFALDSGIVNVDAEVSGKNNRFSKNGNTRDVKGDSVLAESLKIGVLCSNASLNKTGSDEENGDKKGSGDPLEIALLLLGDQAGFSRKDLLEEMPEVREEAFDTDTKMMATIHKKGDKYYVAVKGAPEEVLKACTKILSPEGEKGMDDEERKTWLRRNEKMAEGGMRILALAKRTVQSEETDLYEDLTLVSLVGLIDPPRDEVAEAISSCRRAGIGVVMVTGDQPATARAVGSSVGILTDYEGESGMHRVMHGKDLKDPDKLTDEERRELLEARIFTRVNPKQKLDLIALHQKNDAVVAMTGDGVNDAPALKKADIGIAMGKRGTQVAREAADMVLKDDSFSTIVHAVEHGRLIFNNIRKFVLFLLSGNVSEIIAVSLATLVGLPLPLLPLQILFLNMVIDVFPALALGLGEGDPGIMSRPPRGTKEPVLTRGHWHAILGYGIAISFTVLGSLWLALFLLDMDRQHAVTISFLTLSFARLWHVFNMRDRGSKFFHNDITRNRFIWGALVLCTGLILGIVYVPTLGVILKIAVPTMTGWLLISVMSLIPLMIGQTMKRFASETHTAIQSGS